MPISLFINHLLAQETHARDQLRAHAGKIACVDLGIYQLRLQIDADGWCQTAPADAPDNVKIMLKVSDLPLIAANRERAFSYVKIAGDAEFANVISHLSQNLRWEAEEDLSKLFGDIAAVRMVAAGKSVAQTLQQTHQKIQENLAEYFLEENPMLVRPAQVEQLGQDVNRLRDDTERLQKRIEKLERLR
jgi:ubiquinone biosynthesis protein UbiJ